VIFQDPYESLNPRQRVGAIVVEGLKIHRIGTRDERRQRVLEALEEVGLSPAGEYLDRFPHELSGGQRQRVAIAACLVLRPRFLVADEPISMLDVSVGAGILRIFDRLREHHRLGILMVTHDLATASSVADRIAVMYLGRVVEVGGATDLLTRPRHPYTRALLDASPGHTGERGPKLPSGEPPNPANLPTGCRFHPRCPLAVAACRAAEPALETTADGHAVACLRAVEGLAP
jgi:peptide/nickel transport system ATP-binding protein